MRPTPRIALVVVLIFALAARAHEPVADMLEAAQTFLGALDPAQRKQATYALTDAERENWNFVPTTRQGLPLKQMTPPQRDLALALLRSGLSQRGYARAEAIMSMELVLKALENGAARRDPTNYYVTVFDPPLAGKSWGWRFEGHHVAFNFTIVEGTHVFFTPGFIGSNPAEVRSGPRQGERVLGEEEDRGHALVQSLDEAQRKLAVFDTRAPGEIITTNKHRIDPLAPTGIPATQLTAAQREQLVALIALYVGRWRPEIADATMAEITKAGIERVRFAWAGALGRGDGGSYYRIQGPTFLIEFDNTQNEANHIHTTFREFKGDFGRDLLAEHYASEHRK